MVDSLQKMQDGWRIETRIRSCGVNKGSQYNVYKDPNSGVSYWSLKAAIKAGFTCGGEVPDGRRKRGADPKEEASKKSKHS